MPQFYLDWQLPMMSHHWMHISNLLTNWNWKHEKERTLSNSWIDIVCHMLQNTVLIEPKHVVYNSKRFGNIPPFFSSHIKAKYAEMRELGEKPANLKKLCVIRIRTCIRYKSDENFASLSLPPGLLPLVTLSRLADEMQQMYTKAKENCST